MSRHRLHPADRVLRARLRETVRFPDLTERRALKLSAIPHYTSRAHFNLWHRHMGGPDFADGSGIFTPLFHVDFETTDLALDIDEPLLVHGETHLAATRTRAGEVDRLVREGRHTVLVRRADGDRVVARAHLINVFTRYDPDPARRRVTTLPGRLGLGEAPARVIDLPTLESLVPNDRQPDFADTETHVWHYGQTDPNRHVSGMEYLRVMEASVAAALQRRGHDLRRLYYARARIIYRKPCFRGEAYRCVAWIHGEAPLIVAGAVLKAGDPPGSRPAVAVELTLAQHAEPA